MRKQLYLLFLLLLSVQLTIAQTARYEYWLDNGYQGRTVVANSVTDVALNLDISSLTPGLHFFNVRAQSTSGQWGGLSRYLFFVREEASPNASAMTMYEYWLDNSFSERTTVNGVTSDVALNLDISNLKPGLHYFNVRAQSQSGQWGGLSRYLFFVREDADPNASAMTKYEYWLDNSFNERTTVNGVTSDVALNLDISNLKPGLHYFNVRAQGQSGQWGGLSRYLFFVKEESGVNGLSSVEYWFDDRQNVKTESVIGDEMVLTVDISGLSGGTHTFYLEGIGNNGSRSLMDAYEFTVEAGEVEPYAVLSENNTVLTFYYDDLKVARSGMSVGPFENDVDRGWSQEPVTTAVFDASFANCTTITSTANWFANCYNLTSITGIKYLNTSNVTDMSNMFFDCFELNALDVSHFNTSNVTNMLQMFYSCSSLTLLDVSNFNTSKVTDMTAMFFGCSSLTSLDVSHFDTSNVTSLGFATYTGDFGNLVLVTWGMFGGCSSLTGLDVSHFNTSKVSDMSGLFWNCSSLTSIDVSNFDTSNVGSMAAMFEGCSSLTTLDVSHFNTSKVYSMEFMFKGCSSLSMIDVSHFATPLLDELHGMFMDCSSLTSVDLSSFELKQNDLWVNTMFSGCSALTTVYASDKWQLNSVYKGEDMFAGCTNLVGGAGTTYDENHIDYTYARIDGGPNSQTPGYFTDKNALPVVVDNIQFEDPETKRICVENWDTNGDGELSYEEAAAVQSIGAVFAESQIGTFNEFRYFTGVRELVRNTFYLCPLLREVTLPEELTYIGAYAFAKSPLLKTVDIPQTVVAFGQSAFEGCTGLTSIILPDNIEDLGGWALGNCTSLTSIVIPKKITSLSRRLLCGNTGLTSVTLPETLISIGESAMEGCTSLKNITIPQGVTEIGPNAFTSTGLTSVTIPASVTMIAQGAFSGTETLTSVTSEIVSPFEIESSVFAEKTYEEATLFVPEGTVDAYKNTPAWSRFFRIRQIGDGGDPEPYAVLSENNTKLTFYYDNRKTERNGMSVGPFESYSDREWHEQRESIIYVVFDASFADCTNITSTDYWFYECSKLTSIAGISNLKTDNVTAMRSMFFGCSELTSLDVSGFNTTNVTDMQSMFCGCSSLTSLDVSHFNTANVANMSYMFSSCSGLTSLGVSNFNTANVTDMEGMFNACSGLMNLDVSSFNTAKVTEMQSMFSSCSGLMSLDLSNFNTADVTDMSSMFFGCSSLMSLDVSHFNTTNVTNMAEMFHNCSSLISLDLSHFDTANVTDMMFMFSGCSSLTSLDVSHFNTQNVTCMWELFYDCSGLTSLDVSHFNTSNVTDMSGMFYNCSGLTSLDVTGFNTQNVKNMGGMFFSCSGLTSLDVTGFNTQNVTFMRGMFSSCSGLMSLDLSNFKTDNLAYMGWMFRNCSNLLALNISNFDTSNVTEYDDLFSECPSLACIVVGNANIPAEQYARIQNPNLLVYVNEAGLAPQGVQNVVVNGVAQEIVLTDAEGNNNWFCPQEFRAEKISYTREFKQRTQIGVSRGWESIALPFAVETITHEQRGQIAPFGNGTSGLHFWLRRLGRNGLASSQRIEANTPYVISMPNTDEYPERYNLSGRVTFSAENATVAVTEPVMDESADYIMAPVFQRMAASEDIYALNVGDERNGHPEGSIFERNYREVRPFEAYTLHQGTGPAPQYFALGDLTTTSLETVQSSKIKVQSENEWYTLDGRKLQNAPTAKGLYILNGNKVIVK